MQLPKYASTGTFSLLFKFLSPCLRCKRICAVEDESLRLHDRAPLIADENKEKDRAKGVIYLIISVRNAVLQDKTIYSNKWLYSRVWYSWLCIKLLSAYPASMLKESNPPRCIHTEQSQGSSSVPYDHFNSHGNLSRSCYSRWRLGRLDVSAVGEKREESGDVSILMEVILLSLN